MGRVGMRLHHRGVPSVPPIPVLPVPWMNRLRWAAAMPPPRRNSSGGEKEHRLPKSGGFEARNAIVACVLHSAGAGRELEQKVPIKESEECMAPHCFDPAFKDALWASSSSARHSPCRASPSMRGHRWGRGTGQDAEWGKDRCFQLPIWGALAAPSPLTTSMLPFFGYKHRAKAIQFMNLVLSPWNCTEGLKRDDLGCPFALRLLSLHSSL